MFCKETRGARKEYDNKTLLPNSNHVCIWRAVTTQLWGHFFCLKLWTAFLVPSVTFLRLHLSTYSAKIPFRNAEWGCYQFSHFYLLWFIIYEYIIFFLNCMMLFVIGFYFLLCCFRLHFSWFMSASPSPNAILLWNYAWKVKPCCPNCRRIVLLNSIKNKWKKTGPCPVDSEYSDVFSMCGHIHLWGGRGFHWVSFWLLQSLLDHSPHNLSPHPPHLSLPVLSNYGL